MKLTSATVTIEGENSYLQAYLDPFNKRIRIDDFCGNTNYAIGKAEQLAQEHQAEKLIFKVRHELLLPFFEKGFRPEAVVDRYFLGSDAFFFSKFYTMDRKKNHHWIIEDQIIKSIGDLKPLHEKISLPKDYALIGADISCAEELASLYQRVFQIYPTPLHDPEYIIKTMKEGTFYYVFSYQGKIVSAASAEINAAYKNAELTDCATVPEHRQYGLMKYLLQELEGYLRKKGIYCIYSIARALSFGMNAVLFQLGYSYRGRFLNNCYIYDKLENMNMWVKDLSRINGQ